MSGTGTLTLSFVDVYGKKVKDRVDIFLKHTVLSNAPVIRHHNANNDIQISNLISTHGGTYLLSVYPSNYRSNRQFVNIREDRDKSLVLTLAVLPEKVTKVNFPAYTSLPDTLETLLQNSNVEGFPEKQGEDLFQALDDISRAGLLNIATKMRHTTFANELSVLNYVNSLTRIRGDRFFAHVAKELRDAVKNSMATGLFHDASGILHTPPPNYQRAGSFKTSERYGNLQLTFFSNPQALDFIVDADIDDAQGLEHIFQLIDNIGGATHPYNIHEILVGYQNIDLMYSFIL